MTKRKPQKKRKTKKPALTKAEKIAKQEKAAAKKLIDPTTLEEVAGSNKDHMELLLFLASYHKHNRNATQAYKYLHPNCNLNSCRVLGSRMRAKLAKVNISMLLETHDLGLETLFEKLKEGLNASEVEVISSEVKGKGKKQKVVQKEIERPNHSIRKVYFDSLKEMHGFGGEKEQVGQNMNVQINNANQIENISDDELDDLVS